MEWHINDLSLHGQFTDAVAFREALEPILQLRRQRRDLGARIYCSRFIHLRPVTHALNLQMAIMATRDQLFKSLALEWFSKSGPFWDDERMANPNDYFEFEGEDITDQGLGEAARRCLEETRAGSFSFPATRFANTPLLIQHGLPEEPLGEVAIPHAWKVADLAAFAGPSAASWTEVLDTARAQMNLLIFSAEIAQQLKASPFHSGIASRILELLQVLQALATETSEDSSLTPVGMELRQKHFVGTKAAFTDESKSNKDDFSNELKFYDPSNSAVKFSCPWHGKVKQGQFRIHFEWPRPVGQREFKVVYIGPKITKH